jgi:hypothetical protein
MSTGKFGKLRIVTNTGEGDTYISIADIHLSDLLGIAANEGGGVIELSLKSSDHAKDPHLTQEITAERCPGSEECRVVVKHNPNTGRVTASTRDLTTIPTSCFSCVGQRVASAAKIIPKFPNAASPVVATDID